MRPEIDDIIVCSCKISMHDANPFAFQDLPNAMNAAEITDKLGLHSLRNRNWYIQVNPTTSLSGIYMKQHFLTYGTLCCTTAQIHSLSCCTT
jgi:hypothetical protein